MHAFIPTAATPNTTIHLIRHHRESVDTCYLSGQVMANVGRMGGRLRTYLLLQLCGGALRKLVGSLMAIWLGWISSAREV